MRGIWRALFTLTVVLAVLGVFFYLTARYLWPPPETGAIEVVGIIEAPEVNITSRIAGRIKQLNLLEGDQVEQGQTVCLIEDTDLRNQLAKARADLAKDEADFADAERTYSRYARLFGEKVISAKDRDDALARLEKTRASVAASKAQADLYRDQMADTAIRSPISGIVVSKNLEVGEWVTPGTPILTVDDLSTIWVRVDLGETDLGSIRIGQSARVTLPTHPPRVFAGQVMAIGQEGQFATQRDVRRGRQDIRTFYVKVRVLQAAGELKPGMTAEVTIPRLDEIAISGNTDAGTH